MNEEHDPAVQHVLRFFRSDGLHPRHQQIGNDFQAFAHKLASWAPHSRETTIALRYLLLAKDAVIRATLD